jgi:putative membrane protein
VKRCLAIAMLAIAAACSRDTAQQAHPQPPARPSPAESLATQDRDFIERAAEGNLAEVAMGLLVNGHAVRPEVIALGRMIAADHRNSQQQLEAIAAKKRIALPSGLGEHQATYDQLIDLQRDDFDRGFVRVMIDEHSQAIELFRGEASGGVDPELEAYAAASLPKLEAHLEQAKALAGIAENPPK